MNKKRIIILVLTLVIIICGIIFIAGAVISNNNRNYEIEEITQKNYYTLYSKGKVGVINTKGEVLIEPVYEDIQIPNPQKPVFICLSNYKPQSDSYDICIKNEQNQEIFTEYDEVSSIQINGITGEIPYEKSILKYKKDNKYGLLSFEGVEITQPIYEEIDSLPYKEGEVLVKKDGVFGVLNPKGFEMVKIEYDEISGDGYYDKNYKKAGYIAGTKEQNGYQYTYIKNDGKVLLKKEFNDIVRINDVKDSDNIYLIVSKNGKKGLYKNDRQILDCDCQSLEYNEDTNLIIAKRNDKFGVYDLNGDVILPVENKELSIRGIRIVTTNGEETSEYNFEGLKIRNNKYKSVSATPNNEFFITVDQSNFYGLINSRDIEVIENKYAYLEYLTGEYFTVYNDNNKIGVIDSNGAAILDTKYDIIQKIKDSNIIQTVQIENKVVELYLDDMKQIARMEDANIHIYDKYIKLESPNNISYFNFDGKELNNKEALPDNKLFAIVKNGKWGFEDKDGNVVVTPKYDAVTEFNEYGFAGIKQVDKWGVIGEDGKIIIEPVYTIEQKNVDPEFLGKYYKINYNGTNYYTDEITE